MCGHCSKQCPNEDLPQQDGSANAQQGGGGNPPGGSVNSQGGGGGTQGGPDRAAGGGGRSIASTLTSNSSGGNNGTPEEEGIKTPGVVCTLCETNAMKKADRVAASNANTAEKNEELAVVGQSVHTQHLLQFEVCNGTAERPGDLSVGVQWRAAHNKRASKVWFQESVVSQEWSHQHPKF